ncbi:pyridine nucleotide-disulfide oxidoreductase [Colletotrichum asianum]|uniref:Pyridine nucleotide-disulfide oxidoreductase n=1 Tax=Colletotrichum asianum TaxID=702518 RepID=A0A8H3ZV09_9PEZI|nr:pyridine nucleotide-disulfide oxidoreductase [Colletotrichum asianum]
MSSLPQSGILLEAEEFQDYGGWILDSQFDSEMGSPYLLAHGNGKPVADATTVLSTEKGHYHVWVRAKDWVPDHHPGQFTLTINEDTLDTVFGTNNEDWSWQMTSPLIQELSQRHADGDLLAKQLLDAEPNATIFMEYTVYDAHLVGSAITSLDARHARTGREIRLSAPTFIDCSGKAVLGILTGAETLFGQESKSMYGESLAPAEADDMHHDLRGQLREPGLENGPGPLVVPPNLVPDPTADMRMKGPLTHFWEYGQWLDPYTNGEHIRDHLLCAIYGTFHNVKTMEPENYANLEFDWVAFVAAQGEFKRYKGDYVLAETDIRDHKAFPDAVVQNAGAFCLHYPGDEKYDFRLRAWEWDERDKKPYDIPFRCLFSTNISNLMMAGKHISTTHIGGSNAKFMANGGQHALASAAAAHLCKKHRTTPRGIHDDHLQELKATTGNLGQGIWDRKSDNRL